ncbi:alpha/beta-hydrolase [Hypoxylon trugodes]|uniref:alpha/beta-hydrolase n=1 Tax=Hypoxylon trugodes TaxID=326681 RepID=UPI002190DB78|nr:alpha/beta-hydrolase [Hypoxylon trugodes]KAI1385545.1 alpha/beta-hydrolase [Hypoxylon trugodes]
MATIKAAVLLVLCQLYCLVVAVDSTVELSCNRYSGYSTPNGVSQWLGIRYAAPPVGDLRFEPPQDPPCSKATQDATQHGKVCLSTDDSPPSDTTAEDCLFLDVYAPTKATPKSKLPVYFFIHGGGFNTDSNPNMNGSGLIKASDYNIVVVTINYRVGPYGFITDGDKIKPNNGLRDQRKALQWVNQNIKQFGGDPGHVVIGGDSAGAASVSLQMIAYGGKDSGLFHGAAAESVSFAPVLTVNESQYQYDNFTATAGCSGPNSLACMRNKTVYELQAANHGVPYPGQKKAPLYMWNPVLDYDIIRDHTYDEFTNGNFVKIPSIFGDDTNGGTVFTPQNTSTIEESHEFMLDQFPYLTPEQLLKLDLMYPNPNTTCPNTGCYWRQVSNVYGDMRYACPTLYINGALMQHGVSGSYSYRYNVEDPDQVAQGYGVPHTAELVAVWGPQNTDGDPPKSYLSNGTNVDVIPVIQAYWTSFIRTFDPNTFRHPGSATWEKFNQAKQNRLLFENGGKTTMETVGLDMQAHCKYFASIGVDNHQ